MHKLSTYELRVDETGHLIIPAELQAATGWQVGDSVTAIQAEDGLILVPARLLVPEFAEYLSELLAEKGLTVTDLLAGGEVEREKLFRERYGHLATD